jgi:NTP pyrophosphatase (non-canonical NTP hydrolase)
LSFVICLIRCCAFPFHVFVQMNNLNEGICDVLVDAIFHTRLAQVYLAGNEIKKARAKNDSCAAARGILMSHSP